MLERGDALAVGQRHVGARGDEHPHDLRVGGAPVPEGDGLEQRGPAEPVDVVDVDVRSRQPRTVATRPRSAAGISAVPPRRFVAATRTRPQAAGSAAMLAWRSERDTPSASARSASALPGACASRSSSAVMPSRPAVEVIAGGAGGGPC
jgi:hypothetical protein